MTIKRKSYLGRLKTKKFIDYSKKKLNLAYNTKKKNIILPVKNRESDIVSEHIKAEWHKWVLMLIGAAVMFFTFTFSRELGRNEGTIIEIEKKVEKSTNKIDQLFKKINKLELKETENSLKIDNINNNRK